MKERQKKMITFLGPYVGLIFLTVVLTILTGGDVIAPGNLKLVMEQSIITVKCWSCICYEYGNAGFICRCKHLYLLLYDCEGQSD